MSTNPNVRRFLGSVHSLVIIDDWLLAIFQTNSYAWDFLSWVGEAINDPDREVPEKIYIALVHSTDEEGMPQPLELGKIVKKKLNINDGGDPEDRLIYTALYNSNEAVAIQNIIKRLWPQIAEAIYD